MEPAHPHVLVESGVDRVRRAVEPARGADDRVAAQEAAAPVAGQQLEDHRGPHPEAGVGGGDADQLVGDVDRVRRVRAAEPPGRYSGV